MADAPRPAHAPRAGFFPHASTTHAAYLQVTDASNWAHLPASARFDAWRALQGFGEYASAEEHAARLAVFSRRAARVDAINAAYDAGEGSWRARINRRAALTDKEVKAANGFRPATDGTGKAAWFLVS